MCRGRNQGAARVVALYTGVKGRRLAAGPPARATNRGDGVPDWLQGNEWAVLALALVLGVVEAATVDFIFMMMAGGAVAAAVVALLRVSGPSRRCSSRPSCRSRCSASSGYREEAPRHSGRAHAIGTARCIGRVGVAVEAIDERHGLLRVDGDTDGTDRCRGHPHLGRLAGAGHRGRRRDPRRDAGGAAAGRAPAPLNEPR